MKIRFEIYDCLYNCALTVKDARGERSFFVNMEEVSEGERGILELDVCGGAFDLCVVPHMIDYRSLMNELEVSGWKERLAKAVGNVVLSAFENVLLRVGCQYRLTGLKDGDTVAVRGQEYLCKSLDRLDLFDLIPVAYMFFEVFCGDRLFELLDAFETNRKEVVKSAKKITMIDFGLHLIFTYPIQVGRVKRLTANRRIFKTLIKFNRMSERERERFLAKKEKSASQ